MSAGRAVPWAVVGFVVGAGLGLAWGKRAKSRIGESVTTDVHDGKVTVQVDMWKAAASGLPLLDRWTR